MESATSQNVVADMQPTSRTKHSRANAMSSSQRDATHPLTSSATFRAELTTKSAYDVYQGRLAYIRAKREPYYDGAKHDFKNGATVVRQLRELATFAAAQAIDSKTALSLQEQRYDHLCLEWKHVRDEYRCSFEPLRIELFDLLHEIEPCEFDLFSDANTSSSLLETHFNTRIDSFDNADFAYFESFPLEHLHLRIHPSVEKNINLKRSRMDSITPSHIPEAKHSRFATFVLEMGKVLDQKYNNSSDEVRLAVEKYRAEMPALLKRWDQLHAGCMWKMVEIEEQISNTENKVEGFASMNRAFDAYEKWCSHDANFAQSLTLFTAHFRLLDLPRELRDKIFGFLLSFDYNVSATHQVSDQAAKWRRFNFDYDHDRLSMNNRGCITFHRLDQSYQFVRFESTPSCKLWSHPLFQTSRRVRHEATEQFYKRNSFALRSMASLTRDLLPHPDILSLITDLSMLWTSLGEMSVKTVQALKLLTRLRFLKIYVDWGLIRSRTENNLSGISAFESVLNHLKYEVPSIEKIEVIEVLPYPYEEQQQERILDVMLRVKQETTLISDYGPGFDVENPKPATGECYGWMDYHLGGYEEENDIEFSARVLHPQEAGTGYERDSRLILADVKDELPQGQTLLERSVVMSILGEISDAVVEKRQQRIENVAAQQARNDSKLLFHRRQVEEMEAISRKEANLDPTEQHKSIEEAVGPVDAVNSLASIDLASTIFDMWSDDSEPDLFWGSFNDFFD